MGIVFPPQFTCLLRGRRAVSLDQRVLSVPVKSCEYPLCPEVLQAGGRAPHHVVISASVIPLLCRLGEDLSPGAEDHAASLVVGEAIITNTGVGIWGLRIEPGLVREINCEGTIRHPL